jgi:DNA-binding MarR family transcriptional regulator
MYMDKEYKQVCDDVMRLLDKFKLAISQLAEAHGLTKMQLFLLYTLERQGETAMGRIADVMHCDASNVTGIVDRLVANDLISRQELATDRRTKTVQLTAKGEKIIAALKAELPGRLGCDKLTYTDAEALHTITQKLSV